MGMFSLWPLQIAKNTRASQSDVMHHKIMTSRISVWLLGSGGTVYHSLANVLRRLVSPEFVVSPSVY